MSSVITHRIYLTAKNQAIVARRCTPVKYNTFISCLVLQKIFDININSHNSHSWCAIRNPLHQIYDHNTFHSWNMLASLSYCCGRFYVLLYYSIFIMCMYFLIILVTVHL